MPNMLEDHAALLSKSKSPFVVGEVEEARAQLLPPPPALLLLLLLAVAAAAAADHIMSC